MSIDISVEYEFEDGPSYLGDHRHIEISPGTDSDLASLAERVTQAKVIVSFGARAVTFILNADFVEENGADYVDGHEVVKLGRIA